MYICVILKNLICEYNKLKKSLSLIIAAVFFLSTFVGELQSCICDDTIEVITENTTYGSNKTECSDSEEETKESCYKKHNGDNCNACSVTKQKIEQPYTISISKTTSKELLKQNYESCFITTYINSEHISYSGSIPDIHTRIFISVSNLRI